MLLSLVSFVVVIFGWLRLAEFDGGGRLGEAVVLEGLRMRLITIASVRMMRMSFL